jgi:ureidoacrylate peracid hydrolase
MNTVIADFTERAGTGRVLKAEPEAIQLVPEQTALIVIDMQNAYTSIGGYLDLAGLMYPKPNLWLKTFKKRSAAHGGHSGDLL